MSHLSPFNRLALLATLCLFGCSEVVKSGTYITEAGEKMHVSTRSMAAFSIKDAKGRCALFWAASEAKPIHFSGASCGRGEEFEASIKSGQPFSDDWSAEILNENRTAIRFTHKGEKPYVARLMP